MEIKRNRRSKRSRLTMEEAMVKQYYGTELYHHGVKGQKWGERLYQNEDGSLTPLGKARRQAQLRRVTRAKDKQKKQAIKAKQKEEKRAERAAKIEERKALKEARKQAKKDKTKVIRQYDLGEYSDQELKDRTNRLRIENDYLRERETYAKLNPRAISTGERIVSSLKKAAATSFSNAMQKVGQEMLEKTLRKMLLNDKAESRDNKLKKYGLDKMSDDDLKKAVARRSMEDSYINSLEGKSNNKKNN